MSRLRHLLSPVSIGGLALRNRIAMAPMGVEIVEPDGVVREPTVAYYAERARGGVGLIITENTAACYPRGANSAREIGVSDDAFLPGLRALTRGVHAFGTRIAIQLAHHGKVARHDTHEGRELLMPSVPREAFGISGPLDLSGEEIGWMAKAAGGAPRIRAASLEDLERLTADFARAAERARRAGFDAVELHGAHGYVFSAFLSPAWNHRDDAYGGSAENRTRLLCEVLRACKQSAGSDFPVWCRIDAMEFGTPGGIRPAEAVRTAELLEQAGADAIHVSAYANPLGAGFTDAPLVHAAGGLVDFAARIKRAVSVPVIAAGRIEPELGDRLVRDGRADLVAMGRKLLADPALVARLEQGRPEQIRPCVYCYVCVAQPFFDRTVRCAVNPAAAHEQEVAERLDRPAPQPRRVLVVGGGPAGLEAASVAAARGHRVTLIEREPRLGGALRLAALVYEPNERLLDFLVQRARSLPIEIRTGFEATPERVLALAPDLVIAALGARRVPCELPGATLPHVWDGDALRAALGGGPGDGASSGLSLAARLAVRAGHFTGISGDPTWLRRATRAWMPLGRRVAIVGGGLVGVELAAFVAERGREVVVIEEEPVLALEMAHPRRWRVLHELREAGVSLRSGTRVREITRHHVQVEAVDGSAEGAESIPADSVVITRGLAPNPEPVGRLRSTGVPVEVIGDAGGVGYLEGAIGDGFRVALSL